MSYVVRIVSSVCTALDSKRMRITFIEAIAAQFGDAIYDATESGKIIVLIILNSEKNLVKLFNIFNFLTLEIICLYWVSFVTLI